MAPEKDWPASASGAAAFGRKDAGEELVVIGVAGDDVTGAEVMGEEVTAETAGLAAGGVAFTPAVAADAGATATDDGH